MNKLLSINGARIVLCLLMVGVMASMATSIVKLRTYEEIGRIELSDTTWLVAQTRFEFFRFASTLDLYAQPGSGVTKEDLMQRLDVLWSRLPLFIEGRDSQRYAAVPGLQELVSGLMAMLKDIEPALHELGKGEVDAYRTLRQRFDQKAKPLDDLIVSALVRDEGKSIFVNTQLEQVHQELNLSLAGLVVSGLGLILLLFRENLSVHRAEALAKSAVHRLRVAIDSVGDGFVLFDGDNRLVLCNRQYQELHAPISDLFMPGCRFEDIQRALVDGWVIPDACRDPDGWIAARMALHRNPRGAFELALSDDRWVRISERRTQDGGSVGIVTDITELKQREFALQEAKDVADRANKAKTSFLANMSHELRTPLNAIIGFSEIMVAQLMGPLGSDRYAEYAADIHQSGKLLLALINDILDMAKIEAGRLELSEEVVRLDAVTADVVRMLRHRAAEGGVELSYDLPPGNCLVRADERMLRQILLNLLSNAVKFTPAGGRVTVALAHDTAGGLQVRISDTGIGIAPEDIDRVMQPFVQLENHLQRRYEGTGLGLSLVKAMVELHGGSFRLLSEAGFGTTAVVTLPPERVGGTPAATFAKQPERRVRNDRLVAS